MREVLENEEGAAFRNISAERLINMVIATTDGVERCRHQQEGYFGNWEHQRISFSSLSCSL